MATNIILWIQAVMKESIEEIIEYEKVQIKITRDGNEGIVKNTTLKVSSSW